MSVFIGVLLKIAQKEQAIQTRGECLRRVWYSHTVEYDTARQGRTNELLLHGQTSKQLRVEKASPRDMHPV